MPSTTQDLKEFLILKDLDMDFHHLLHMPLRHFVHATLEAGATDVTIESIPAGTLEQDFHVYKIAVSVDAAPGDGKTVSASVTNGVDIVTIDISGADTTTGSTTVGAFDVDVSSQPLTLKYSETAGSVSKKVTVLIMYYYIKTM